MAGNVQISIKDEASARAWLASVQEIHEAYIVAMQEASDTLASMNDFCEGTLVDDFVKVAYDLLSASQKIFQGIDEIADTVGGIIGAVGSFIDSATGVIKSTMNKLFG